MIRKFIVLGILALSLSACVNGKLVLPTSIANPVTGTNLYEAELVFDATLKTFIELKGLCANRTLPRSCRTYVIQGQNLIRNASAADVAARKFVTANPTLDPTNVVQAFVGIVSDFKNTVTALSATK